MSRRKVPAPGTLVPTKGLVEGTLDLRRLGAVLGWWWKDKGRGRVAKLPVHNAGELRLGTTVTHLGLVPDEPNIYLARSGRLWRLPGVILPARVRRPERDDTESWQLWADRYARSVLDRLAHGTEAQAMREGQKRYRAVVRALVMDRVLEAAELGFEISARTLAEGVCETWDEQDLLLPRYATMQHGLYVALVLALPADRAAELLELAALLEYRVGFVTREAGLAVYAQAARVLGVLCPAWANRGYLTPWHQEGSIDRLLRAHYTRTMNAALARQVPIDVAAGLQLQGLSMQAVEGETTRVLEGVRADLGAEGGDGEEEWSGGEE